MILKLKPRTHCLDSTQSRDNIAHGEVRDDVDNQHLLNRCLEAQSRWLELYKILVGRKYDAFEEAQPDSAGRTFCVPTRSLEQSAKCRSGKEDVRVY